MDRFSHACRDFALTISLKKTNVLGQDVDTPPVTTIDNYQLEVVHEFTYLGSTITDNLSLDAELNKRIGKAATTLGRLATRVWENTKLTTKTKMAVYNACVVSTLLYGSHLCPGLTLIRCTPNFDIQHEVSPCSSSQLQHHLCLRIK